MSFGEVLKEQRKIAGLTQVKLAESSGVSRTYLSDVENDRYNPSVQFIEKVTNGLAEKKDLTSNERNQLYNLLIDKAGYGFKPLKDLTDKEIAEQVKKMATSNKKRRADFVQSLSQIDPDSLDFGQEMILRSAVGFATKYGNINNKKALPAVFGILRQLNAMYDTYADENLSIEEKKEGIESYLDDLKTNEVVQNLFDDIANYFINELENNPS